MVPHQERVVGHANRYSDASRHPALPGSNAPVASSRIRRCRQVDRRLASRQKFEKLSQHSRSRPLDAIATHAENTLEGCRASAPWIIIGLTEPESTAPDQLGDTLATPFATPAARIEFVNRVLPGDDLVFVPNPPVRRNTKYKSISGTCRPSPSDKASCGRPENSCRRSRIHQSCQFTTLVGAAVH